MPVTTERLEAHIYVTTYSESPSIKEMLAMVEYRKTVADNHSETYFVSMPYDVSSVRRTLAISALLHVRAVIEAFRSLLGLKMEFYDTLDEALERKREAS